MKTIATVTLLCAFPPLQATPTQNLFACELAANQRIELASEPRGPAGSTLFLKFSGATVKAFDDFPDVEFVGSVVLSKCVDHVLVFGMNYGPPYIKGEAIRANHRTHAIERINFAEKSTPKWIYSGPRDMLLVFPNLGNESARKFIVYRFVSDVGQEENPSFVDQLPRRTSYKVSKID